MKRITKLQKQIVDAHLEAAKKGNFTFMKTDKFNGSLTDARQALREGKTFEFLHRHIEARFCTLGSSIAAALFNGAYSSNYLKDYRRGFKTFLNESEVV